MIVEAEGVSNKKALQEDKGIAIIDQQDQQFVPHVLAIEKNQKVNFPNSDDIKHHVYSFSATKVFEQQLYKGRESTPVIFENAGLVELGCNIHDWMLGYIYVAQGPLYGVTNKSGKLMFEHVSNVSRIHLWHPLLPDNHTRLSFPVKNNQKSITIKMKTKLIEDFGDYERLSIDVY